jgi:Lon-like ATP-dependent protease
MEQMKQIMKELGIEKDDKQSLIGNFHDAIKDKTIPEEANKVIENELTKLGSLEPSSSEFNVCRTYLEWLTCLPWNTLTEDNKDIKKAESILNEDHYGLEDVKERILEHIAVSFLKGSVQGKIMCLVGPPGVGKTSIGKSVARSLDRKFYRFSVGGLHDVAELRGHRRTYVGAMPGKLIQCLKLTQSSNPVVLIDEIDKLGRDFRGDPSSALLEILDPEQNNSFRDHYLDVPVDLSQVLFLCTANVLDSIPGPLLDRFEVIRIAGYVYEEKMAIAKQYLIPQTKETSGVGEENLHLDEEVLTKIIQDYAREAGVRHLRKLLEKVSRKVALSMVRKTEESKERAVISLDNLTKYIGQPVHLSDRLYPFGTPAGVIMGLAWTAMGGASLFIEARGRLNDQAISVVEGDKAGESTGVVGSGGLGNPMKVTGQLGQVMNESSEIALTYSRLFLRELAPKNSFLDDAHIHLHVPEGATPKDGPSAGVTMTTALMSLALGEPIKSDVAMTGELTITGKVLKIGGLKEKVIAARRERVTTIIFPRLNEPDWTELKDYLRVGMTAHFVDHYDDVYRLAFPADKVPILPRPSLGKPAVSVVEPDTLETKVTDDSKDAGAEASKDPGETAVPPPTELPVSPGVARMSCQHKRSIRDADR